MLAGSYVFYYGYYELRLNNGGDPAQGPISFVGDISGDITTWVNDLGVTATLVSAGIVVTGLLATLVLAWQSRRSRSERAH